MTNEQARQLVASLTGARDAASVERWAYEIEDLVVPINDSLRPGADAVAACLVAGLATATAESRAEVLHLLVQLAASVVEADDPDSVRELRQEIERGLPAFEAVADTGSGGERLVCVDLFSTCARFGRSCYDRSTKVMSRLAEGGADLKARAAVEFDDLRVNGYPARFDPPALGE
ncbi:hypothetical protein [Streptomyces sp. A0592]|uniref:hypothetical protein n=1 Tax=Streptomyces sp. A0592 TaxID=2563099 RepID=UPI00109EBC1E|nr:hypothetical protein [Streptomyces sp. A0592]THA83525.1 hypothetical protein E6U81_16300 [Streptomyces sp. A0592]